jgi:MFS family permease
MLAEIRVRRRIYVPMFLALAFTSLDMGAILPWRAAFWQRSYDWSPAQIGAWSGTATLIFSSIGVLYGTWLVERLARRHADAPLRAQMANYVCCFPFMLASPLMPTAELSILSAAVASMFSTAGAIPQIAALQIITPNTMRGQVSAVWLFMFTVVAGFGASVLTAIQSLLGGEQHLGGAMAIMIGIMLPAAFLTISTALRPYREEIRARSALT